jgi:hypothetical protein
LEFPSLEIAVEANGRERNMLATIHARARRCHSFSIGHYGLRIESSAAKLATVRASTHVASVGAALNMGQAMRHPLANHLPHQRV